MKKHKFVLMYCVWIVFYIGAVLLSLLDNVQGGGKLLLQIFSVLFFVPGAFVAVWAVRQKNEKQLWLLRLVSGMSLGLTLVVLVINFLCVSASIQVGRVLNSFLILVSAPMMISYNWAISLFLWACLLMVTIPGVILPRKKK